MNLASPSRLSRLCQDRGDSPYDPESPSLALVSLGTAGPFPCGLSRGAWSGESSTRSTTTLSAPGAIETGSGTLRWPS